MPISDEINRIVLELTAKDEIVTYKILDRAIRVLTNNEVFLDPDKKIFDGPKDKALSVITIIRYLQGMEKDYEKVSMALSILDLRIHVIPPAKDGLATCQTVDDGLRWKRFVDKIQRIAEMGVLQFNIL